MSKQYKTDMLKDKEPEGEMLYGIEVPAEIVKGFAENPLCENFHSKHVYKQKRRDRINNKKARKREKGSW